MTDDEMIEEYLRAVLEAFTKKALKYYAAATDTQQRFARTTEIKNALKAIGTPTVTRGVGNLMVRAANDNFSIAAGEYSHCPEGVCNGQVCTTRLSFGGDDELRELAGRLGFADDFFFPA